MITKGISFYGTVMSLLATFSIASAGPLQRVPNTTLTLPPQPPQYVGYLVNNAFPTVSLSGPVCIASPPGETNRLFILERSGNIVVITNLAAPTRTVFMSLSTSFDSESGLIGLAFHPNYASNGFFYVFCTTNLTTIQGTGRHQRISRFQVNPSNPNQGLASSQLPLITQFDTQGNHNGGDLHFGSDGYLYASVGDEGLQYNGDFNAQIITNKFFSAILRIDVDKRPGNLAPNPNPASSSGNYSIPADNPFIGRTNFFGQTVNSNMIRTEFYSVGYRNPWRFSIDPTTGLLYVADVGQDHYEEVDVVTNGANCGWSYYEGTHLAHNIYPSQPGILVNPPAGLTGPIIDYSHDGSGTTNGNAVIGGFVYRGTRISQLYGAYVFTDNGSGNVWIVRPNGFNFVPMQRIAGASQPSAFGVDPRNGDVLICQLGNNQIGRLDYNGLPVGTPLPATLADTGAFSDLATLTPNAGIVSYDLNVPFWSDNAIKTRWFSVPNTNLTIGFNPDSNWSFPTGSVWIKHFELELTNGVPESRQRIETRFIVRNTNGIYGITYRWDSPTTASLVAEAGMDEAFTINDGGTLRTQVWHYPSRSECLACHTPQGGFALGFNTAQLNRDHDYGGTVTNQLDALSDAGYFNNTVSNRYLLRALVAATDDTVSREYRVRSYLAANCVQCHQAGNGPAPAMWDARLSTIGPQTGIINGALNNNFGDSNNRVIAPGSLSNSIMLQRIANLGSGHMPPLDTTVVNTQAVALLSAWITNDLAAYQSFADWQLVYFGSTNAPNAAALADPDNDGAKNYLEYLTGTVPTNSADAWRISLTASGTGAQIGFPQIANRGFEVQSTTSLINSNFWAALNVPGNAPFFSSSNRAAQVPFPIVPATPTFYRVRVFEP